MLPRTSARVACVAKKQKVVEKVGATTFKRHLLPKAAYDFRRLNAKANFKVAPTDDTFFVFPRERLGLDYKLNISLNRNHKLTPQNEAFRNLHLRHLAMHARGSVDKSRSITYPVTGAENTEVFWVPSTLNAKLQVPSTAKQMSESHFRKIGRLIADVIGDSPSVFVHDAAFGSHRLAEVKTRTITNDAAVSLTLRHTLVPTVASTQDVVQWPYEVTVMVAPQLNLSAAQLAELGLKSNSFAILNPERGLLLVGGTNSSAQIKSALQSLAGSRMVNWSVPSLPLAAHVVQAKGNVGLVFDPSSILTHPKNADLVSGFEGAVWNDYGVFRQWGSVAHGDAAVAREFADTVEKVGDKVVVTQPVKNQPIAYSQPAAVVFLIRDSTGVLPGVARVNASVAAQLFTAGYNGTNSTAMYNRHGSAEPVGTSAKLFASLVEAKQTPVFVVNTRRRDGAELTAEETRAVINAALDGSLAKTKGVADATLKMEVISSVAGVKTSLDASKGFKDKAQYTAEAAKLASSLGL